MAVLFGGAAPARAARSPEVFLSKRKDAGALAGGKMGEMRGLWDA